MTEMNQPSPSPVPSQPPPADGKAITAMVLGIVSVVLCCIPAVGPACGTIAIVLFAKFNTAYNLSGQQLGGRGMAIAGLITGIIGAAFGLFYTIYWIFLSFIIKSATSSLGALPWK